MSLYIDVNNISNACIYVHWNTIIPNQVGDKQVLEIFQTYNKQKKTNKSVLHSDFWSVTFYPFIAVPTLITLVKAFDFSMLNMHKKNFSVKNEIYDYD